MPKYILKKIYDIRPLNEEGEIDFEWIKKGKRKARAERKKKKIYPKQKKKVDLKKLKPRWEREEQKETNKVSSQPPRKKLKIRKKLNWKRLSPNWEKLASGWRSMKKPKLRFSFPRLNFAYIRPRGSYFSFLVTLLLLAISIAGFSFFGEAAKLKSQALASGNKAYSQIQKARTNLEKLDSKAAQRNFENAYKSFKSVENQSFLNKASFKLASIIPTSNQITAGRKLVKAGQYFSQGGAQLTETLSLVKSVKIDSFLEAGEDANLGQLLQKSNLSINRALEKFKKANQFAQSTKVEEVPAAYQDKVKTLQARLPQLINLLSRQKKYLKLAQTFVGEDELKRYLIIFQNNSEIRATGGFIGSYAEVTFFDGKLKDLKVDDIYNIDGQLSAQIIPPEPIQKISSGWSTHDANWFFDFPTSAEKVMKFYELTGQSSVEGVVAITPEVLKQVLEATGPVELPKYEKKITSDNFLTVLQKHIEKDYNEKINQPKRILADFAPKIIEELSQAQKEKLQKLVVEAQKMLAHKDILLYSKNENLQREIELNGWGGNVIQGSDDYLAIVNANINGYKTDRYMKQNTDLKINLNSSQKIKHQLKVTRKHKGGNKDQSFYNEVNSNYMRIFLPAEAKITSVEGFTPERIEPPVDYQELGFKKDPLVEKIKEAKEYHSKKGYFESQQHGKKVIGGWVYTSPGKKTKVKINYSLPAPKSKKEFNLLLQKQPGQDKHNLNLTLRAPKNLQIERGPKDLKQINKNKVSLETLFQKDELISVSLE